MRKFLVRLLAPRRWALLFAAALFVPAALAQIDVELELSGPWSYAPDPWHKGRIIVAVPDAGHSLKVFTGDDPLYSGTHQETPSNTTIHRLNFHSVGGCGTNASTFNLYPPPKGAQGVDVKTKLTTHFSGYAISLPKPCYFQQMSASRMKYGAAHLGDTDKDFPFTTVMTLHYKARKTTRKARFEAGSGLSPVPFGSNSAAHKLGISIVAYIDSSVGADTTCDKHSGHAFYQTEMLWGLTTVNRLFPEIRETNGNSNEQLNVYADCCIQDKDSDPMASSCPQGVAPKSESKTPDAVAKPVDAGQQHREMASRADCHAPQVNINGAVQ